MIIVLPLAAGTTGNTVGNSSTNGAVSPVTKPQHLLNPLSMAKKQDVDGLVGTKQPPTRYTLNEERSSSLFTSTDGLMGHRKPLPRRSLPPTYSQSQRENEERSQTNNQRQNQVAPVSGNDDFFLNTEDLFAAERKTKKISSVSSKQSDGHSLSKESASRHDSSTTKDDTTQQSSTDGDGKRQKKKKKSTTASSNDLFAAPTSSNTPPASQMMQPAMTPFTPSFDDDASRLFDPSVILSRENS